MPSTAVHPGADHQVFWLLLDATKGSNTILPIHHPFWDQHRPGDRWLRSDVTEGNNCHCSLEATDEHPTAPPRGFELRGNGPQPGLNEHHSDVTIGNNPAKTGRLFAQSHPYFPQSCAQCAFYQGGIANGFKNAQRNCENCPFLQKCIDKAQPSPKGYTQDKKYGERLMISECADEKELEQNLRCARVILKAFDDTEIKIRQHVIEHGIKNPEYEINGAIADRKGIKSIKGVADAFKKAKDQGCSVVVLDLDQWMKNKKIDYKRLSSKIHNRETDFKTGEITTCYVIHNNKATKISGYMDESLIELILNDLRP